MGIFFFSLSVTLQYESKRALPSHRLTFHGIFPLSLSGNKRGKMQARETEKEEDHNNVNKIIEHLIRF